MDNVIKFIDENVEHVFYDWWQEQQCIKLCKQLEKDDDILKAEYDHANKVINVHKRGKIHNIDAVITLST